MIGKSVVMTTRRILNDACTAVVTVNGRSIVAKDWATLAASRREGGGHRPRHHPPQQGRAGRARVQDPRRRPGRRRERHGCRLPGRQRARRPPGQARLARHEGRRTAARGEGRRRRRPPTGRRCSTAPGSSPASSRRAALRRTCRARVPACTRASTSAAGGRPMHATTSAQATRAAASSTARPGHQRRPRSPTPTPHADARTDPLSRPRDRPGSDARPDAAAAPGTDGLCDRVVLGAVHGRFVGQRRSHEGDGDVLGRRPAREGTGQPLVDRAAHRRRPGRHQGRHAPRSISPTGFVSPGTPFDWGKDVEIAGGALDWQVTATGVWFFQNPLYPLPQQWTIRWSFPNGQSCGAVFTVTA